MAFKIKPFYNIDSTPIYSVSMEDGVLGMANNNGTILVNKNIPPSKLKKVIDHKQEQIDKTINLTQDELQALLQEYAQEILHEYERHNRRGDPRRT